MIYEDWHLNHTTTQRKAVSIVVNVFFGIISVNYTIVIFYSAFETLFNLIFYINSL